MAIGAVRAFFEANHHHDELQSFSKKCKAQKLSQRRFTWSETSRRAGLSILGRSMCASRPSDVYQQYHSKRQRVAVLTGGDTL